MNRNILFIAVALLLWGFGEGMFYNFVPIYLNSQFQLDETQIGLVLGAFGFFMAITHIPAGRLADRVGRKPLLITAWVLGFISTLVMGIALSLPLFLIGLFGYGLTAFVSAPLSSYMTAARGKWAVGTALSLSTATFATGMVLGPVTGGWIGDKYGMRTSFLVASVVFLLSNICMFFIERQPLDHHDPAAPPPHLRQNRELVVLFAVIGFAIFAMYIAQPLTPNFLTGVRGLSLSETGLIFTAGALGNSLMAIFFSRAQPRRGFILAQMMVALFALCIWKGNGLAAFALGYFLLGGFRASRPMSLAQARALVHDSQMGVTYGIIETISSIILILTPPLAGILFDINPVIVYPIAIVLIAISMIISYRFSPRKVSHA
ncbi:MAG: MFS transporter [Bacteroidota bacterium]